MKEINSKKRLGSIFKEPDKLIYAAVAVMLVAMALIIGITAASNRARKNKLPTPVTDPAAQITTDTNRAPIIKTDEPITGEPIAPVTTEAPADTAPTGAEIISKLDIPVNGTLTKPHSPDVLIRSLTMNDYRAHLGIDIAAAVGESVLCPADGIVKEVWSDPMMGRCVSIAHTGGLVTVFKNLDNTLASGIEAGKELKTGDVIGIIGESALIEIAEAPHLHFETELDGKQVDPMRYFDKSVFADASEDFEG